MLDADPNVIDVSTINREVGASAKVARRTTRSRTEVGVDTRVRSDTTVVSGRLQQSYRPIRRVEAQADVTIYGPADESPLLSVLGVRDRAMGGLALRWTAREYALMRAAWSRYQGRNGGTLGTGYSVEGEVGHAVPARPRVELRIIGKYMDNSLAANGRVPVTDLIPDSFALAGAAASVGERAVGRPLGPSLRLRPLADLWVAWILPADGDATVGYNVQGGAALGILAVGELSARAFFANLAGADANESTYGVSVWYAHFL
jgi:hypothetical protein